MEKLTRLPPGFRFCPTDEELVVQYLKRKAMACPLPAAIIPEIELDKYDPWDLPGCREGEKYFFTLGQAKHRKVSLTNKRATVSGFWKATGKDMPIFIPKRSEVVGMKRVFTFHQGKPLRGVVRTEWIMHEYRLVNNLETMPYLAQGGEWVVCRISKKKKGAKRDEEVPHYYNHNLQVQNDRQFGLSSPCSSSSCVTNLSNEECSIGEEASSNLIV